MSQICEFYKGQHVFITGGNGFIGKVLVEKLLRSTDVTCVYLLLRRKKGKDVAMRLDEMLENEPFRKLRDQHPDFKRRIKVLVGDSSLPDLGLSVVDYKTVVSKITVVFHVAATVRFQEDIKVAYATNVGMTEKIITLCKQIKNLKSLIYVSTAYANCYLKTIDETIYDGLDFDYKKIDAILQDSDGAEKLTKKILEKWPNTYSFTKAVAELLLQENAGDLLVGIFRPSIVLSTYKEPLEGWTDSFGGPNTLVATVCSGFTRHFCCNIEYMVDLVPVDMTVAALIASAWDVHQQRRNHISIYNYVSSVDNPITYDEFIKLNVMVNGYNYPFNNSLWVTKLTVTRKYPFLNFLFDATYHYLPALLVDITSLLTFKRPSLISKYRKFIPSRYQMEYFMSHEWIFTNTNVRTMWDKMNDADKKMFPFDMSTVNWVVFMRNYYKGLRFHLFKEPWHNLEKARIKAKRFQMAHYILIFVMYSIGLTTLWTLLFKIIGLKQLKLRLLKRILK